MSETNLPTRTNSFQKDFVAPEDYTATLREAASSVQDETEEIQRITGVLSLTENPTRGMLGLEAKVSRQM